MIKYKLIGTFGVGDKIKDFCSQSGEQPSVAIHEDSKFSDTRSEAVQDSYGWYDVTVYELDEALAKEVLAEINSVDSDEIEIIQTGAINTASA